jgi:hypothetical protein
MKNICVCTFILVCFFTLASAFEPTKPGIEVYGFYGNICGLMFPTADVVTQTPLLNSSCDIVEDLTSAISEAQNQYLCFESQSICLAKFQRNINNDEPMLNTFQSIYIEGNWVE